jgi:hypothetical protein
MRVKDLERKRESVKRERKKRERGREKHINGFNV